MFPGSPGLRSTVERRRVSNLPPPRLTLRVVAQPSSARDVSLSMPRLRALGAFLAFVVVQELVGDGAGWLVFQKLALVEPKWQPSSFMVIEGIAFIAALVGALAAAAIQ